MIGLLAGAVGDCAGVVPPLHAANSLGRIAGLLATIVIINRDRTTLDAPIHGFA